MAIQITARTEGTDPAEFVDLTGRDVARAVTAAVAAATEGLKQDLRTQVRNAGLGTRLGNAIRSGAFPKPPRYSPRAAGTVRANGNAADILEAFSLGVTITPGSGRRALAIPTSRVPRGRYGRALTPSEARLRFGQRLVLIPGRGRGGNRIFPKADAALALLEATATKRGVRKNAPGRRGKAPVILYWLVPSARIPKRITPEAAAREWADRLPGLTAQAAGQMSFGVR